MSWIQALYDTYNRLEQDEKIVADESLLKVGHSTANAHIEVTVDKVGKFKNAQFVDKDKAVTTIPVTEDSGSRGAGIFPHPLFDKLKYIAKDFETYTKEKNSDYYSAYMQGLNDWCESGYSDAKILAVYDYLDKGHLIGDLIASGILSVNEQGILTKKWENAEGYKLSVGGQSDAFVRFRVEGCGYITALWEDTELQDKYVEYYLEKDVETQFCYVTGKEIRGCIKHPSKIRNSGDKSKLISANDNTNFTFRGRFAEANEAYSISYEVSQKVHNALKWLIEKQGTRVGEKIFVLWGVDGEKIPDVLAGTFDFLLDEEENEVDTAQTIADRFSKAINGYKGELKNESHLLILGLDAATTGRLAVVFQREYYGIKSSEQLIDNIERWHKTCCWHNYYKNEKEEYVGYSGAPAPITIARAAFGNNQNGLLKGNDKLFSQTIERLLPCIVDGKKVPRDIVVATVNKSKTPQNYSSRSQWLSVVSVACALYRRYLSDYKEEEITMAVQETNDMAYNCGRLLAIADAIEARALLSKSENKSIRATSAMRYFTRFAQRPCETWGIINQKLIVYREQLGAKGTKLYKMLGEVSDKIDVDKFREATNLDGAFILGFDSQRLALMSSNKETNNDALVNEQED